jgi:alpha-1,3-rhamnosyl/mannosyltransferase
MHHKILVNVTSIRYPLTGIGYYTLYIVEELLSREVEVCGIRNGKLLGRNQLFELVDFYKNLKKSNKKSNHFRASLISFMRSIPGIYLLKKYVTSVRAMRNMYTTAKRGYTYFEPNFIPMNYKGNIVTTVHDLSFIKYPEFHPAARVKYLEKLITESVERSSHVIVDSDFILNQLHDIYPSTINKSSTVYLGVTNDFKPYSTAECQELLSSLNLNRKKFILSVATLEPRKNLQTLVKAYKLIPEKIRREYPLVLVGDEGWKNTKLMAEASELIASKEILFTGYLSDIALKKLYASALIFSYPSLYEGFGLPVVEAMSSGTAVITSDIGATSEVAGHGAVLVDPHDPVLLARKIEELLLNREMREQVVVSGIERARQFTWQKTVDDILNVIEKFKSVT